MVHCVQGVSRSATLVLAFLLTRRGMRLLAATSLLLQARDICPNDGFLRQLAELDLKLFL